MGGQMFEVIRFATLGLLATACSIAAPWNALGACLRAPDDPPAGYQHDRWVTLPVENERRFGAFTVSFEGSDAVGDEQQHAPGIPRWVAMEIRSFEGSCIPTGSRPNQWCTDAQLLAAGRAPTDASYEYPQSFRNAHPDWYDRGHLAMKFLAERLGNDAAWNTHSVLNAVPQRHKFNAGIWLDLEELTGAWAQKYEQVWVITGPVIPDGTSPGRIGEPDKGEFLVTVPDALFKVVVRDPRPEEGERPELPQVLAFIYPQVGAGYAAAPYNHARYLTTVDEIEETTGLDLLSSLPDSIEREVERTEAPNVWPSDEEFFVAACHQ
jgi:endonuclease G, mitochondrial